MNSVSHERVKVGARIEFNFRHDNGFLIKAEGRVFLVAKEGGDTQGAEIIYVWVESDTRLFNFAGSDQTGHEVRILFGNILQVLQ
ncbi:MAG: hypothetical protein AAB660_01765 [Patescibacteria group bacterium]